jgi:hypothetical protein
MLDRRWDILKNFEDKYKEKFLRNLTEEKSLEILKDLYLFAQEIVDKNYFKRLNKRKIQTLAKVHSMFMKVK